MSDTTIVDQAASHFDRNERRIIGMWLGIALALGVLVSLPLAVLFGLTWGLGMAGLGLILGVFTPILLVVWPLTAWLVGSRTYERVRNAP